MTFLRTGCELVFRPLIAERRVVIDAVATVQQAGFVKIDVSSPTGEDPIKLCMPYLPEFRTYCRLHPSLVRYSHMVEQYIKQALVPAPVTTIESVELCRASREAIIRVPASVLGRFVGIKGMNVAVAIRLTGHGIRVVPAEQVMPPCLLGRGGKVYECTSSFASSGCISTTEGPAISLARGAAGAKP